MAGASELAVGNVFNLGGPPPISLMRLAELLVELNHSGSFVVKSFPSERKVIDIGDYFADDSLIRTTLGWTHEIGLETALRRTLAYYRRELPYYL